MHEEKRPVSSEEQVATVDPLRFELVDILETLEVVLQDGGEFDRDALFEAIDSLEEESLRPVWMFKKSVRRMIVYPD
jgi:hypothetical protein